MILTSTVIMYFLMSMHVNEFARIYLSQTRVYMAILMGLSVLLVLGSFGLIQNQVGVDDTAWMRTMEL